MVIHSFKNYLLRDMLGTVFIRDAVEQDGQDSVLKVEGLQQAINMQINK